MASSALPCPVPPLPSGASRAGCGWPSLLSLRRLPTTMVAQDRNSTSPITTPATSSGDTSRLVSPPSSPGLGKALEALLWFEAAAGRERDREKCHLSQGSHRASDTATAPTPALGKSRFLHPFLGLPGTDPSNRCPVIGNIPLEPLGCDP